jgi:hypothetical protein
VLHPSGSGQDLGMLKLVLGNFASRVIEDHAASAGRTLIDCSDEVRHDGTLAVRAFVQHPGSA